MALIRWNPWSELFDLHSQMDQLFETRGNGHEFANLPVDIRQTDDAFIIDASVPGFRPDDVEVTFDDGVLTIKGGRGGESEKKGGNYVRRERRHSSVFRQVGLPAEVRADQISAAFDNGVLHITVPRAQKAQPKRIPVTSAAGSEPKVVEHKS